MHLCMHGYSLALADTCMSTTVSDNPHPSAPSYSATTPHLLIILEDNCFRVCCPLMQLHCDVKQRSAMCKSLTHHNSAHSHTATQGRNIMCKLQHGPALLSTGPLGSAQMCNTRFIHLLKSLLTMRCPLTGHVGPRNLTHASSQLEHSF